MQQGFVFFVVQCSSHSSKQVGQLNAEVFECTGCLSVRYCSEECQRADWNERHKPKCKEMNERRLNPRKFDVCASCGKSNAKQQCTGCMKTRYCSRECQMSHWSEHKEECKK